MLELEIEITGDNLDYVTIGDNYRNRDNLDYVKIRDKWR